ncbi:MAG TPA: universal stress protein [Pseudomonas sp.]|nr:universal stress protein [Pseudomonas sp.]
MKFRQLLVVIDPTQESQPALERAAWVARRNGAAIELLLCEHHSALEGGLLDGRRLQHARDALLEQRRGELEKLAEPLRAEGLAVTCEVRWGRPLYKMILARVDELKPDILFRNAYQHSLLQRLLFTSNSWQLIRKCPCPLWLTGARPWEPKRVCAAVDPLHSADKPAALDHQLIAATRELAGTLQLEASYVHAYSPLPRTMVFDVELVADYDAYCHKYGAQHREAFDRLLAGYEGAAGQGHLVEGLAEQAVPRFVEEQNIDLLLMGAIARGHLDNALIGNTAERILEAVKCDLLVMKPQGFGSPGEV